MPAATERLVQDPNDFLMGGGVPSASLKQIGATVQGTICEPPPFLQQQTDFTTNIPKVWDNGDPMMHMVVTLQTDENDPEIEEDDGRRRIYVKNNMKRAIADAVRKAKAKALELGGQLTVNYTGNGTPSKAGMQPPKLYDAHYIPPGQSFLNDERNENGEGQHPVDEATQPIESWSDAVRFAAKWGVSVDDLKAEFKKAGIAKWDSTTTPKFVVDTCNRIGIPF